MEDKGRNLMVLCSQSDSRWRVLHLPGRKFQMEKSWAGPMEGTAKINVDAVFALAGNRESAVGAMARDHRSEVLAARH